MSMGTPDEADFSVDSPKRGYVPSVVSSADASAPIGMICIGRVSSTALAVQFEVPHVETDVSVREYSGHSVRETAMVNPYARSLFRTATSTSDKKGVSWSARRAR